jgi:hypothetical protein
MFQHGDLILIPVDEIPPEATPSKKPRLLAEGELTGHAHVVSMLGAMVLEHMGRKFLEAPNGANPTHEEHHEIALPPGKYEIRRVQEHDPVSDLPRPVSD